jgi:SSS family solute:Na+ symporter
MMAASGNFVGDFLARRSWGPRSDRAQLRASMVSTALIGIGAVFLASQFERVLDIILHAYTFMVAGLLVPTLGVFYFPRGTSAAAVASMVVGGVSALTAMLGVWTPPFSLDPSLTGILLSAGTYLGVSAGERRFVG